MKTEGDVVVPVGPEAAMTIASNRIVVIYSFLQMTGAAQRLGRTPRQSRNEKYGTLEVRITAAACVIEGAEAVVLELHS